MLAETQRSPSPCPCWQQGQLQHSAQDRVQLDCEYLQRMETYSLGNLSYCFPTPRVKKVGFFSSSFSCVIFCVNGISHVSVCTCFLLFILVALRRIWLHLCFLKSHYHCSFYSVLLSKHRRGFFCALLICFANSRNVIIKEVSPILAFLESPTNICGLTLLTLHAQGISECRKCQVKNFEYQCEMHCHQYKIQVLQN